MIRVCFLCIRNYEIKTSLMDKPQKVNKTDKEWKAQLTDEQYRVLRQSGTERPFTGQFYLNKEDGMYICAGCETPLFSSETKFDSGCGWPSFMEPVQSENVKEVLDKSHGMIRTEIRCATCDGHLGHVFNDGPGANGLRYCINSVSLGFNKKEDE